MNEIGTDSIDSIESLKEQLAEERSKEHMKENLSKKLNIKSQPVSTQTNQTLSVPTLVRDSTLIGSKQESV